MKNIFISLFALALFISCQQPKLNALKTDAEFEQYKLHFVDNLWKTYPGWASSLGYHNYDSVLIVPNEASRKKELAFVNDVKDSLKAFDFEKLTANNKTDYKLIENFADGAIFGINEFKSYAWDPSSYNLGDALFAVLDYKGASLDDRLKNISKKLLNAPAYFEAAKKNINKPTREHTQLAIDQNKGSLSFFNSIFPDSLKASKLNDAEKADFTKHADSAKHSIENYLAWLDKEVLPKLDSTNSSSFRIGKELYGKKFLLDIDSRYTADEMYKKALERKTMLHQEMNHLATLLWSKHMGKKKAPTDTLEKIKQVIDMLSLQHCKREDFLPTIEKQLPELTVFINQHHIITLDSTKPLKVRKTPDYQAGVAGAGINSPGPYDKDAVTYYNVTPLTNYKPDQAESYLREYNTYVLQILNIHEAIPGHYMQLIYANRSPSIIKSIFGNGAMIEGWACYVERMMIEQGYNDSPEMRLFYDKWNLREVCNYLLDYNIHCNNWTEQQVNDLLVKEAFQQSAEAHEKWKRATLTQVQLTSYFAGQTEILELRQAVKQQQGKDFDLKKFHEQFLSYGSAPVKEISELMLSGK